MEPLATDVILESISDGVFTVDLEWKITSFNRAAEEITGVMREDAVGGLCGEVFRSSLCGAECAMQQTLQSGKAVVAKSAYIVRADGEQVPVSISTSVLRDGSGNVVGGVEVFRDLTEVEALRHELGGRYRAGDLISRSQLMQRIFAVLPAIAESQSTVLIQGETGTGKELIARTLHNLSLRRDKPFVAVNCGALPDTLLESELFGYKAGAFTGAVKDKPGRFALAEGGTIFLDEIGEITPALQVRLLRILQERVYEPLGGTKSMAADIRVIAATNRDLLELTKSGEFREDLYYRVNIVSVDLPPLRNRKEDIPLLAQEFIRHFNTLQDKQIAGFDPEAMSLLMAYEWPGNVRELENLVERAFILCNSGMIKLKHLPETVIRLVTPEDESASTGGLQQALDVSEARVIYAALRRNNWQRQATADELGMHKTTLFRKIKRLKIEIPRKGE